MLTISQQNMQSYSERIKLCEWIFILSGSSQAKKLLDRVNNLTISHVENAVSFRKNRTVWTRVKGTLQSHKIGMEPIHVRHRTHPCIALRGNHTMWTISFKSTQSIFHIANANKKTHRVNETLSVTTSLPRKPWDQPISTCSTNSSNSSSIDPKEQSSFPPLAPLAFLFTNSSNSLSIDPKEQSSFPPLAHSIFCRFYRISFTTHKKKNITHVVQWLFMTNLTPVVLTSNVTRMHSSRMHTARSSSHHVGVCLAGRLPGVILEICLVWAWRPPHPGQTPQVPPWVWAWRPARNAGITPPLCEQNDWQTGVKTQPSQTSFVGGKE